MRTSFVSPQFRMGRPKKPAVQWFAERTSMHGVPSLVKSRSTRSKAFWAFVCMIAMGMFLFMLISLIIKYLSFPTVVKTEEVPKGLVTPTISFCNKRYSSMMSEIAFAKLATNLVFEKSSDLDLNSTLVGVVEDVFNLLNSLDMLRVIINKTEHHSDLSVSTEEKEQIKEWSEIKDLLNERKLVTTLLFQHSENAGDQMFRLDVLQGAIRDTMVYCGRRGKQCNDKHIKKILGINNLNCYMYTDGQKSPEHTIQGISNGVTFVFMTGSGILANEFGDKPNLWNIPGFRNTFHTSAGSDGIRLMIHDPELSPMPEIDGIDISPGMDTTIGVSSQENIRLPHPYGECSTDNIETDRFLRSIESRRGFSPIEGAGMVATRYSPATCRGTCLLRHIWERCDCMLMSGSMPFVNTSLLCGYVDTQMLYNPVKFGKEKCFLSEEEFMKHECQSFVGKLLNDLKCVQDVLGTPNKQSSSEDIVSCDCPMACHSRNYETSVGTSKWPSPGPDLDAAYGSIVEKIVIPYFQQFNSTLAKKPIDYLSKKENKLEIMQNFARVTIYIKNLKVDKIEQVAAYTALDLVSDIGGQLGLWVGISAITLCEILGFFSLLIQRSCNPVRKKTIHL